MFQSEIRMKLISISKEAEKGLFLGYIIRRVKVRLVFLSRRKFSESNSINVRRHLIFRCLPLITPVIIKGVNDAQVVNIKHTRLKWVINGALESNY